MNRKQATRLTILAKLRQGDEIHPSEIACNQGLRGTTINDILNDLKREGLAKPDYAYTDWNNQTRKYETYNIWTAGANLDVQPVSGPVMVTELVSATKVGPVVKSPVTASYGRTTDDLLLDAMQPTPYDGWLAEEMAYAGGRY